MAATSLCVLLERALPVALVLLATHCPAVGAPDFRKPGPREVGAIDIELADSERERRLPARMYIPRGDDRVPVVIFSHGLGGSREGGRAWGEHWASHGFLSIHLQHPGSDEAVVREAVKARGRDAMSEAMSPRAFAARVGDVRFLVDRIERDPASLHAALVRVDPRRIGMSGHSYGARTTLALAGERVPFSAGEFSEPRIVASIAFSPYAPPPPDSWPKRFGEIRRPVLSVTGTHDRDLLLGNSPEIRREPYRHMPAGDKYLLVLQGADHMVFNGQGGFRGGLSKTEVLIYDHVRAVTTAFWYAYLSNDAAAKQWLTAGAGRAALGSHATLEQK